MVAEQTVPKQDAGGKARGGSGGPYGLSAEIVREVREGLSEIPPPSRLVCALMEELTSPLGDTRCVARLAATDPSLAAALLRTVNSSAFGLSRPILSVQEAVTYLGFSTVSSLVLRLKLGELLKPREGARVYDPEEHWQHSITVSQVAEALARRTGCAEAGFAGTAGLLHDIGKAAINTRFPQMVAHAYCGSAHGAGTFLEREQMVFGADHALIGAFLAAQWRLPDRLVTAIRLHHDLAGAAEEGVDESLLKLIGVVFVANQLAKKFHVCCGNREPEPIPSGLLKSLGLPGDLEQVVPEIQPVVMRSLVIGNARQGCTL